MRLDLADLDAFAAVAATRSFRRAAAARGVSASTLSQAVRDLEARLGVRLLHRTTRSVAPTEAGARLLERLAPALSDIAEAVDRVAETDAAPAGTLRINAPPPAVELVLAPLLPGFLAAHPQVRIDLVTDSALVDIVEGGFDAGVRWGEHLAQDMVAVPFGGEQRFVVVATPELVARTGAPVVPADLLARPCLRQRFPDGRLFPWEFEKDGRTVRIDAEGPLVSTNGALLHQATLAGLGYWATFSEYSAADVAAGRLIPVLEDWLPPFPGPYLYYPSRQMRPALRALVDFIRARRAPTRG
jgi:DNA-binding transcriptional LysR family regulator